MSWHLQACANWAAAFNQTMKIRKHCPLPKSTYVSTFNPHKSKSARMNARNVGRRPWDASQSKSKHCVTPNLKQPSTLTHVMSLNLENWHTRMSSTNTGRCMCTTNADQTNKDQQHFNCTANVNDTCQQKHVQQTNQCNQNVPPTHVTTNAQYHQQTNYGNQ
jgi:hypothetical protein